MSKINFGFARFSGPHPTIIRSSCWFYPHDIPKVFGFIPQSNLDELQRPYCDLTGIMVVRDNHPQMALFQVGEILLLTQPNDPCQKKRSFSRKKTNEVRCDGETSRPLRFRCRLRHANTYVWWGPQTYVNVGFWFYPKKSEFQTFVDVRCIYHHRNHLVINQPVATEAQLAEIPGVGLKKPTVQPMTRPVDPRVDHHYP